MCVCVCVFESLKQSQFILTFAQRNSFLELAAWFQPVQSLPLTQSGPSPQDLPRVSSVFVENEHTYTVEETIEA